MGEDPQPLDPALERRLAVDLFNETWRLLRAPERDAAAEAAVIHVAHASRHHWSRIGTPAHLARGEWMVSRVYSELGRGEPALWHARRALDLVETGGDGFEEWDRAAALEGLARATLVAGDPDAARVLVAEAHAELASVEDEEDREIVAAGLDELGLDG